MEMADMKHCDDNVSNISSADMINSWTWGKQPGYYCHYWTIDVCLNNCC